MLPPAIALAAFLLAAPPLVAQGRFEPNAYVSGLAGPAGVSRAMVTSCDTDQGTQTSLVGEVLGGVRVWRRFHLEASGTLHTPIPTLCPATGSPTQPMDGTVVRDSFPDRSSVLGSAQLRVRYVPERGGWSIAGGGGWLEPQGALIASGSLLQFIGGAVQFGFGGTVTGVRLPCQEVRRTYEAGALVDTRIEGGHCWRVLLGARLGVVLPIEIVPRGASRGRGRRR